MGWRIGVWLLAGVAVFLPRTGALVESRYANGLFPWLQRLLTTLSNLLPFALFDLLIVMVIGVFVVRTLRDVGTRRGHDFGRRPRGWRVVAARAALRLVTITAVAYLAFLVTWGLNYRRPALTTRVPFEPSQVTVDRARQLADVTVRRLNALYEGAHREPWNPSGGVDAGLARAFAEMQPIVGNRSAFVPARPKRSMLDLYFRRAGVAGMTDPFFLETLVASDLLIVEQPLVVAHEWSHLAGIADEGEANFAGWITCLRGSALHQYSGWLFLYGEVVDGLSADAAADVAAALAEGPRADLQAIRDRLLRQVNPAISAAGWRVYDGYLKANRVDEGTASYGTVVRLVLGTGSAGVW